VQPPQAAWRAGDSLDRAGKSKLKQQATSPIIAAAPGAHSEPGHDRRRRKL